MNKIVNAITLAACVLTIVGVARAQENITGKWKAEFDSQIGIQKYTYDFKVTGTNLTGKAIGIREMGTNEVAITEGTVSTNGIFFVEPLKFGDNEFASNTPARFPATKSSSIARLATWPRKTSLPNGSRKAAQNPNGTSAQTRHQLVAGKAVTDI